MRMYTSPSFWGGPAERRAEVLKIEEITLALRDSEIFIAIPFSATCNLFARDDGRWIYISTDPRCLADARDMLDERAVYSLLQFGAVAPPLTMWRRVVQLPSGFIWTIAYRWGKLEIRQKGSFRQVLNSDGAFGPGGAPQLIELLDRTLQKLAPCKRPVITFSGGVDSAVLAARAASMGWAETALVHLSSHQHDGETGNARSIANSLGLQLTVIQDDQRHLQKVLETAGSVYYLPFGDCSVVSTSFLAQEIVTRFPDRGVVLDGVGADGCFGLSRKSYNYLNLYRLPAWMRRLAARAYRSGRCYASYGQLEHIFRVIRRSAQLSFPLVGVAQNPLLGIAYHFNENLIDEVGRLILAWLAGGTEGHDCSSELSALDVGLTCCRMFAQKTRPLFDELNMEIRFPFLASDVFEFALAFRDPEGEREPKLVLKQILASQIPAEQVYRKKIGFPVTPMVMFRDQYFLDILDEVISGGGQLGSTLDLAVLRKLRQRLIAGLPLNWQVYNFLWTVVFTQEWLRQVRPLGTRWMGQQGPLAAEECPPQGGVGIYSALSQCRLKELN